MSLKNLSNKRYTLILILVSLILIQAFIIYKLNVGFQTFKASVPFLVAGEQLDYLDLIGMDNQQVSANVLQKGAVTLLFIPGRPCTPCNKSFIYWKKTAQIFKSNVNTFGVVLDDPQEAFDYAEKKKLNFKLYSPVDQKKLMTAFRIKLNMAQTIVLKGNRVHEIIIGDVTDETFPLLVNQIKSALKE